MLATALWLAASLFVFGQGKENKGSEQEQKPQTTIKVDTALVTVEAIVTDRLGRFVTGLNRGDFLVREDGAPQEISNFSSTETPFNVALLIDTSHSTHNKLGIIRKAALTFIKQLQPQDRVLIVSFDEKVRFLGDFTNDHKELEREIHSVQSSYATSLYDAISQTISEKLLPLQGRKAIVVLTDGVDTGSRQATYDSTLDLIARTGIITYAIQYDTRNDGGPVMKPLSVPTIKQQSFLTPVSYRWQGQGQTQSQAPPRQDPPPEKEPPSIQLPSSMRTTIGPPPPSNLPSPTAIPQVRGQGPQPIRDPYIIASNFLRTVALQSGARYIRAEVIENTSHAFEIIADELRHQYALAYYSTNDKRDGKYRTIEVSVKHNDLIVRARHGYLAPKAGPTESESKGAEKKVGDIKR